MKNLRKENGITNLFLIIVIAVLLGLLVILFVTKMSKLNKTEDTRDYSVEQSIVEKDSKDITEENLRQALDVLAEYVICEEDYAIFVQDNIIELYSTRTTYKIEYDLSEKATFSIKILLRPGMPYNEFQMEYANIMLPCIGYIVMAQNNGVEMKDAAKYFFGSYVLNTPEDSDSSNLEGVDYSKIIKDELNTYEWIVEKKDVTSTSYILESKIIVNTDADFSKLEEAIDEIMNSLESSFEN